MRSKLVLSLMMVVSVAFAVGCGTEGNSNRGRKDGMVDDNNNPDNPDDNNNNNNPDDPKPDMAKVEQDPPPVGQVGSACLEDTECPGDANAFCINEADYGWPNGYCVINNCDATNDDCPSGSGCFTFSDDSTSCLKLCDTAADCPPGYACPEYGACTPGCTADSCEGGEVCNPATLECESAPCTATSCPDGMLCADNGRCVANLDDKPTGTVPSCPGLPELECQGTEAVCGALTQFDPHVSTDGSYDDYPINGETAAKQYRSYARKDMVQLIKYATAVVACKGADWTTGNGGMLGLGDMSDKFGDIPGTHDINDKVVNDQGHPAGTHENGRDMDIAYYQVGTSNNYLREVCPHSTGGKEQYHCTDTPDKLDVWRTALFLGTLLEFSRIRVIGVDGKVGALVEAAAGVLCADGWLPQKSCDNFSNKITYEETDMGYGWFLFHHHHLHVSLNSKSGGGTSSFGGPGAGGKPCMDASCKSKSLDFALSTRAKNFGQARIMNPDRKAPVRMSIAR